MPTGTPRSKRSRAKLGNFWVCRAPESRGSFFARQAELESDQQGRLLPRVHIQPVTIPGAVRGKSLRRLLTNFSLLLMFLVLLCAIRPAQFTGFPLGPFSAARRPGESQ